VLLILPCVKPQTVSSHYFMTLRYAIFFFLLFVSACQTSKSDSGITSPVANDTHQVSGNSYKTNLHDTTLISGDFVLFLRPDSSRIEAYASNSEHIYEADSDFGYAIFTTIDFINSARKYQHIKTGVSTNRYVFAEDCMSCPRLIDRNNMEYAVILISKGKEMLIDSSLHSGDYLQTVNHYFNIK
jgi:hypothetical protein